MKEKKNIIYLHSHDTGRFIEPYGYPVLTPNLMKIAEEGVMFRNTFCASPTCSPSRGSLLTGRYPHNNGLTGLAHRGFSLNNYDHHLVNHLRKNGFYTCLIGFQHVASNSRRIGYDEVIGFKGEQAYASNVVPAVNEFLEEDHQKPFFLSAGFFETHRIQDKPPGYRFTDMESTNIGREYCKPPASLPDNPEIRADVADFKESVKIFDRSVGEIIKKLKKTGLIDNTLVIVTTDHGPAFPDMKATLREDGLGVFLIMRGPDRFRGGKVFNQLISQIDLYPTICQWAGLSVPGHVQGRSFLRLAAGNTDEHEEGNGEGRKEENAEGYEEENEKENKNIEGYTYNERNAIFAEFNHHIVSDRQRCIRTKRWKYIKRFENIPRNIIQCDKSPAKTLLMDNGWEDRIDEELKLYDLLFDPLERNNLAYDDEYQEIVNKLDRELERWMIDTEDPALDISN